MKTKLTLLSVCFSLLFVDGIGWTTASAQLIPRLNRQPIRAQQPVQVQPQSVQVQPQPAPVSDAQQARQDRRSQSNQAIVRAKTQRIENEIANLKEHPWAGQFSTGPGLAGFTITLAPENGFTVVHWADIGLMDQNHGTVEWDGKRIKLSLAFEVEEGSRSRIHAAEYMPIQWGERLYLIPTDRIIQFRNAVNAALRNAASFGVAPRIAGQFFLRRGDERKETSETLELSEELLTESARQIAIQKFVEENGRDRLLHYNITMQDRPEEWSVFFEGKIPMPGNHMWVAVNKATGTARYFQGQ